MRNSGNGLRRVAVTGVGIICANGRTASECWSSLCAGRSGIAQIEVPETADLRFRNGAEVRGFKAEDHFKGPQLDLLDRFAQFALVASREAVSDAKLVLDAQSGARIAVITGSSMGGQSSQDVGFRGLYREGRPRPHPFTIPRVMASAGASHIAMEFGCTGPAFTISTACASATHAIGQAFWMVRSGAVDAAITGGSEAPFSLGSLRAWEAMRVISPDSCRPFCRDRRGMVLGEGAAMLVLEPLERALARGAHVHAEITGFGMSCDAGHITQPSCEGPAAAMRSALADAEIAPEQVCYINAHGTGTASNDVMEARAIRSVFNSHVDRVAVSSTKSMHGHALGAAGALEAFATIMALRDCVLPPTANFTELDPECDLDVVANVARRAPVECALSNSFAFGGLNAALVFRKSG